MNRSSLRSRRSRSEESVPSPFLVLSDILLTLLLVLLFYFTALLCILNLNLRMTNTQLQSAQAELLATKAKLESANEQIVAMEAKEKGDRELWPHLVAEHQIAIATRLKIDVCGTSTGRADPEVCYQVDKVTQRFIFNENVLFEKGHSEIKEKGKVFLRSFCPRLSAALREERTGKPWRLDPDIQIEGHADTTGSAVTNWTVSGERALNVVKFITEEKLVPADLQAQLSLAGYSYNRPLQPINWNKDQPRNRRFEMHLVYRSDPSQYPKDSPGAP